jgi:single-stranded-DNA-specific exonuclease
MVIEGDAWHRGVIGITATRVVEKYGRPTLVLSREGEESHGSGRSIPAFHMLDALESCRELFSRYGGHAHAVGFSLPAANVEKLCAHLDSFARARLQIEDFESQLEFDAELPLESVTPELHQALSLLEPFGMDNPEPVFAARAVRLKAPPQAVKDKHVRLMVSPATTPDADDLERGGLPVIDIIPAIGERTGVSATHSASWRRNITFKAMGWGIKESCDQLRLLAGDRLDIAYSLGMNDHPEFGGLELSLQDVKRAK